MWCERYSAYHQILHDDFDSTFDLQNVTLAYWYRQPGVKQVFFLNHGKYTYMDF